MKKLIWDYVSRIRMFRRKPAREERAETVNKLLRSTLFWACVAEFVILLVCFILRPDFFSISYQRSTGMLYGSLIDILNRSAEITIIAMGMTLVIATGGTDLSVGALVAVANSFSLRLMRGSLENVVGDYTMTPFFLVILLPLLLCMALGAFNGLLVSRGGLQPIIATLVLMTAGRGVAQLFTDGGQWTIDYTPFQFIGRGSLFFFPTPVIIWIGIFLIFLIFTRKTAFGMFVESVGVNANASHVAGIKAKNIKLIVYTLTGLLAGISGLVFGSRISANDANNAGLFFELDAILAVVIGGTAMGGGKFSLSGTVVGSIIIRTITTIAYYFGVVAEAIMAFKAIVVVIVIVLQSEPVRKYFATRVQRRRVLMGGEARA